MNQTLGSFIERQESESDFSYLGRLLFVYFSLKMIYVIYNGSLLYLIAAILSFSSKDLPKIKYTQCMMAIFSYYLFTACWLD